MPLCVDRVKARDIDGDAGAHRPGPTQIESGVARPNRQVVTERLGNIVEHAGPARISRCRSLSDRSAEGKQPYCGASTK